MGIFISSQLNDVVYKSDHAQDRIFTGRSVLVPSHLERNSLTESPARAPRTAVHLDVELEEQLAGLCTAWRLRWLVRA
jgi:hypothetical protein